MTATILDKEVGVISLARSLRKVSMDVIDIGTPEIVSHWYRSGNELDLFFMVIDETEIIKQQISIFGQVIEWNKYDGIRTGFLQEVEGVDGKLQETVRFDKEVNPNSLEQACEVLKKVECIEARWLEKISLNYAGDNPNKSSKFGWFSRLFKLFK